MANKAWLCRCFSDVFTVVKMNGGGDEWIDTITKKGIARQGSSGHPASSFFMRSCHKGFGQTWLGEKGTAETLAWVMVEASATNS